MRLALLIICLIISACQPPDSKSNSQNSTDPIYGNWQYITPGSTSENSKGIVAQIDSSNVSFTQYYGCSDGNSVTAYVRKNIGTYNRVGNEFTFKYSYETCNPVVSEKFYINATGSNNSTLSVTTKDGSIQVLFARITPSDTSKLTASLIEDKNCNILSKHQKKNSRSVASQKLKSFFDLISF